MTGEGNPKVHRDKLMSQYDKKFLGYGFGQHKGYPTKLHKQKIQDIGPCVLHRKSFWLRSLSFLTIHHKLEH